MAVAARSLHNLVVLVVARHGLISITLATLFDVPLDLHAQLTLYAAALGEDTIGPVPHRLGVVLVTGAVLGLTQWKHLMVPALVPFFALSCTNTRNIITRSPDGSLR